MKVVITKKIFFTALIILLLGFFSIEAVVEAVGVSPPPGPETPLPDYIKYIFNTAVVLGGVLAAGSLAYAGILFTVSTSDPQKIATAKDQALAGILGLLLLLTSYIILTALNPQLVIVDIPQLKLLNLPTPPPYTPPPASSPIVRGCQEKIPVERTLGRLRQAEENALRKAEEVYLVTKDVKNKAANIESESKKCECKNLTSICSVDRADRTSIPDASGDQCPSYCPPEGDPCPSDLKSKKIPELLKLTADGRKKQVFDLEEAIVEMNEARLELQKSLEEVRNCRVDRNKRLLSCVEAKSEGKVSGCDALDFYCCI